MVRAAKGNPIVGVVAAALRTQRNMMNIEKLRVATTRHGVLLVITAPHGSARRR
jgi:hypothetical protein